jgi:hypothetical protein
MGARGLGAAAAAVTAAVLAMPAAGAAPVTAGAVTTPAVSTPPVTVPSVSTPKVAVPPVSTPAVTVPGVSTPAVRTPAVRAPTASTPAVTVPSVRTPAVRAPSASTPAVRTPAVRAPSASTPAVTAPAPRTPATTQPARTAPAAAAPSVARRAGASSTARGAGAGRTATGHGGARVGTRAAVERRRERVLRRLVRRMRACLGALAPAERRVLLLRAAGRSRGRVAGVTGLPARRVARLERTAVKHLTGACATARRGLASATSPPAPGAGRTSAAAAGLVPRPAARALDLPVGPARFRLGPARLASGSAAGETPSRSSLLGVPVAGQDFVVDLAAALVALSLLAALAAFGREVRRGRGPGSRRL